MEFVRFLGEQLCQIFIYIYVVYIIHNTYNTGLHIYREISKKKLHY